MAAKAAARMAYLQAGRNRFAPGGLCSQSIARKTGKSTSALTMAPRRRTVMESIAMTRHVLILGGARSGKTAFAEQLAIRSGSRPAYLATAEALDGEMRDRVASHKAGRAARFTTIEEPIALSAALLKAGAHHDVILVDCLTLWITNLLMANEDVAKAVSELGATLMELKTAKVILVSNEVGLGIVPDNAMARTFRDLAGAAHQRLAEICDDAYFIVAGLPLTLKGEIPDRGERRIHEA
jgi:adenosylcobinamide kinase / adenosylcobinamide-phosphate guanylyltransferase